MTVDTTILSKPYFGGFSPEPIASQREAFDLLETWDYENDGVVEILLSGSVGSSKSIFVAWYIIWHCLTNRGARVAICRRALPSLRTTLYNELLELLVDDPQLKEGRDWKANATTLGIKFPKWGSEIISVSWADRKTEKVRSLKLSGVAIEEMSENDEKDKEIIISNLFPRLGRVVNVPKSFAIGMTNPADPEHWMYEYYIEGCEKFHNRHVIYSLTKDNPFLPKTYYATQKARYTKLEALRYLEGQWISIKGENLYSSYDMAYNYRKYKYVLDQRAPIVLTWDFNIAANKPMSCAVLQFVNREFHIYAESVIHSARTLNILEDLLDRGIITDSHHYIICGDSSGRNRDTRSLKDDYSLIKSFLEQHEISFEIRVPRANPPIRKRHNKMNLACEHKKFFIYEDAPMAHKGMRLTKLKDGANYIEDDSVPWQHITTALGYSVVTLGKEEKESKTYLL